MLKKIFLISNEPWGDVWFSKHHYANELSKNHKVYFIDPPANWTLFNLFSFKVRQKKVSENLIIIQYDNNFPLFFFNYFFLFLNDLLNSLKFYVYILNYSKKYVLIWQFDPFRFVNVFLKHKRIYHVVDPYNGIKTDPFIARKADLIVIVSQTYINYYKRFNNNIIFIPHGISPDELMVKEKIKEEIKAKYGDFILFVGSINHDVDIPLISKIAYSFSNKILLIGPILIKKETELKKFQKLLDFKNIVYLGPLHSKELKNFVSATVLCIIPYLKGSLHRSQTLKALNYIAQRKIIVSSLLKDSLHLRNKIIFMAENHDDFIMYIKKGLNRELYYDMPCAEKFINDNLYSKHIEKINIALE